MEAGTLAQDVGRMDILLHRGITERVGVRWTQNGHDGDSNPITISIPEGKTKAFVAISARASTPTHDGTPLLEIYEDGKLVGLMTIPDILPANGLSFNQTVGENHSYTIRSKTVTGGATITGVESWFTVIYYG